MKTKNTSKNTIIAVTILVVGVFASYYFLFVDIKNRNEHISNIEQDLAHQNENSQYVSSLLETFQNADSDITKINNSIVSSDGDVAFIESLEKMAHDDSLSTTIDSLNFEEIPSFPGSKVVVFRIRVKAKGSWSGIYKFLAQIESLPFKIKIINFGLTGPLINTESVKNTSDSGRIWQSIFEINVLKYK
ncbi:MAG: hypothetical protein WAX85_02925 [Minisyncoccia bacterium]